MKIDFKISLIGEARRWVDSQERTKTLNELYVGFMQRFTPANYQIAMVSELSEMNIQQGESLLSFLDRMKGVALRGDLPDTLLVAMALKALPRFITNKLVVTGDGFTWNQLYGLCGAQDALLAGCETSGEFHNISAARTYEKKRGNVQIKNKIK